MLEGTPAQGEPLPTDRNPQRSIWRLSQLLINYTNDG